MIVGRWLPSWAVGLLLVLGGLALMFAPTYAPQAVLAGLATAAWPLSRAWRAARGTALRPAVAWAWAAVALGVISQALACVEPPGTGRPLAGHATYLAALATLAALVSVLNARSPGGGAWAILMMLLVLVFLIPWLEAPALARKAQGLERLRLEAPWTLFYVLVVIAGVTNYLPTRYGPAAAWLALGFAVEYVALTRAGLRLEHGARLWSVFPWTLAASAWTAAWRAPRGGGARGELEATWLWFRDHWGVVWALRVLERFNRSAELLGWGLRLGWYGVVPPPAIASAGGPALPPAGVAEATLRGLLRRFVDPARVVEAVAATGTIGGGRSAGGG